MNYHSTRGKSSNISSAAAILQGLAPDGGLYVPEEFPELFLEKEEFLSMTTYEIFQQVLSALLPDIPTEDIRQLLSRGYDHKFETEDLVPLKQVGDRYVLELYHGPTNAFKDMALSLLPHLVTKSRELEKVEEELLIITATSGDTGKAALVGFSDVPHTKIMVFYPEEGVSSLQKIQMLTQEGENVFVCAVKGNFDDAQRGVKEIFAAIESGELQLPDQLSSANSINIGRLAPQVAYYFKAYRDLVQQDVISYGELVDFVVPTGNFGNILAGYFAKKMGLPVGTLVCASNKNDVLTEFLTTGTYNRLREFYKTNSPSMDILVASNLERLLWMLADRPEEVAGYMKQLAEDGKYTVSQQMMDVINQDFFSSSCLDEEALAIIKEVWEKENYLIDPHTGVAWKAANDYQQSRASAHPLVVLSTASPYKFPEAMLEAFGLEDPEDGFQAMDLLEQHTGVAIPKTLLELKHKKMLHNDLIDPKEIISYVNTKVGGK